MLGCLIGVLEDRTMLSDTLLLGVGICVWILFRIKIGIIVYEFLFRGSSAVWSW